MAKAAWMKKTLKGIEIGNNYNTNESQNSYSNNEADPDEI